MTDNAAQPPPYERRSDLNFINDAALDALYQAGGARAVRIEIDNIIDRSRRADGSAVKLAARIAFLYNRNQVEFARVCDEQLDQSGRLLGYIREVAAAAAREEK